MSRVLLTLGPSTGGIGRHVRDLALHLARQAAWEVAVAGPAGLSHGWLSQVAGEAAAIEHFTVSLPGRWSQAPSAYRELSTLVEGFDVVHAHGLRAGLVSSLAGRRCHVPVIATLHNRAHVYGRRRSLALPPIPERLLSVLATEVLAASPDLAHALGPRAHMIPVPADTETPSTAPSDVRRELGIPEDAVLVLAAARLHRQKRLGDLAAAADLLPDDVVVVVAGEGPARAELESEPAVVSGRVRLLGHRDDVPDLVAASDIAVLASAWEAIPLFLKEAGAAGKPLVGTDTGGIPEVVVPGHSGFLVPVGDVRTLAAVLTRLAGDPGLRARLGAGAKELVAASFSPEISFSEVESLYREVLR